MSDKKSSRKQRRYERDYQRAFGKDDAPKYCPVRVDENPINPAGNICGLAGGPGNWRLAAKTPEPIETEGGGVTRWRCFSSSPCHVFGKAPQ